jgi:MFS family permease
VGDHFYRASDHVLNWKVIPMLKHPLFYTLKNLKGNVRACVLTEPMWGIPFNLIFPYASLYMLAFGVHDAQIGMITSLGMGFQTVFALLSGVITDKYGRRMTTFISDVLSWGVASLIWAIAQDIRYFIVAAMINAAWRIPANSWTCLLVEDAEEDQLIHVWTWIYIAGLLSAFFAPLAGILIDAINLVPAVRILYWIAFISMMLKGWVLYHYSTETQQGRLRMKETRDQPFFSLLGGYREVLKQLLKSPRTLVVLGIMLVMSVTLVINGTFWSIIVTNRLNIPAQHIAIYPFAKSALLLALYFVLVPRLNLRRFRNPMLIGYGGFIVSQVLLVTIPAGNYWLLLLSVLIEAFSIAMFRPLMDSLVIISIDKQERARINAIMAVIVLLLASPFGWIAGQLSEISRVLPFILNIGLYVLGSILVVLAWRLSQRDKTPQNIASQT